MLLMLALAAGLAVAALRGGSLLRLGTLRGLWFAIVSFALDALLQHFPAIALGPKAALTTACYFCVLVFVFFNRTYRPAAALLGAGTLCNYVVKAANAFRMPVSVKALQVYAGMTGAEVRAARPDSFSAENGARLLPIGDVFYIPFPGQRAFFSVGDFLIAAGLFLLIVAVVGKRTEKPDAGQAAAKAEGNAQDAESRTPRQN